jgi:hypothetical protein
VKIHPSTVVVPLAVVLLVGAAGAVLATSGTGAPANPIVPAAATATPGATNAPAPTKDPATRPAFEDTALSDALDKLVADGTITADQKTAILGAVTDERQARQAERKAQRDALMAQRDLVKGFLSDGVITQQELDQLPADSPLRSLTSLMDDGKITTDELKTLGRAWFFGGGPGHVRGFFHDKHVDGDKPDGTPSPAPTTSG